MANGHNPSPYSGLARGLVAGARVGLGMAEEARRQREDVNQQAQRELMADLARINADTTFLEKPYIPADMKLQIFNDRVAPLLNKMQSRPGTAVGHENFIGRLDEWPDAMNDIMKNANRAFADMNGGKLSLEQYFDVIAGLQTAAGKSLDLAPMMQRGRERQQHQMRQHVLDAHRMMKDGIQPGEEPLLHEIYQMNPEAILEAQKILREERRAQPGAAKPTKLGEVIDEQGDKIVTLDVGGGKRERVNLGKTKQDESAWRRAVAKRTQGLTTGDPEIDLWTKGQAAAVLDAYNRSDPLKRAVAEQIAGQGGGIPSAEPGSREQAEQDAEEFLKRNR